ncbi:MAG: dimethylsulfonioproprionate lyase family protein [Pseudomonadota bacterium]
MFRLLLTAEPAGEPEVKTTAVPRICLILVADGEKSLFMRNLGDAAFPNFQVRRRGPNGTIVPPGIIPGLVLSAPKSVCPAHGHDGIAESRICLFSAVTQADDGVYAPGSLILCPPGRHHRDTVGNREPCLLAFASAGREANLANQTLSFKKSPSNPGV